AWCERALNCRAPSIRLTLSQPSDPPDARAMTSPLSMHHWLEAILQARLHDAPLAWLSSARDKAGTGSDNDLLQVYAGAARRAGSSPLALTSQERSQSAPTLSGIVFDRWSVDDAVRAMLLLDRAAETADADVFAKSATGCYDQGDA